MPKSYKEFPHNISAAVTPQLKELLDVEMSTSHRPLSAIVREALYEYFEVEPENTINMNLTPAAIAYLKKMGYVD